MQAVTLDPGGIRAPARDEPRDSIAVLAVHSDELLLLGARAVLQDQAWISRILLATGPDQAARIAEVHRPKVAVIRGCAPDGGPVLAARLRTIVDTITVLPFGETSAKDFVRAVRGAADGDGVEHRLESAVGLLSMRELEVLQHLSTGASNGEIARRLYLSPHTVKQHVRRICVKLGARNRVEAIARAQAIGALDGVPPQR